MNIQKKILDMQMYINAAVANYFLPFRLSDTDQSVTCSKWPRDTS